MHRFGVIDKFMGKGVTNNISGWKVKLFENIDSWRTVGSWLPPTIPRKPRKMTTVLPVLEKSWNFSKNPGKMTTVLPVLEKSWNFSKNPGKMRMNLEK